MPSKTNSSLLTARAPYQPVKRLVEVPIAFYEILDLASKGKSDEIVPLIKSIIAVTQADPASLTKLPQLQPVSDMAMAVAE